MKRITHIVIFENYLENYSYQENLLSQKHKELGYEVSIIASQDYRDNDYKYRQREAGEYVNDYGIDIHVLSNTKHNPHLARFFDKCIGLYEKLIKLQPDIIFLHNFSGKDIQYVVKYKMLHPDVKLFVDCHNDFYNKPVNTLIKKFDAWMIRRRAKTLIPYTIKFWGTLPWRVEYLQKVYKVPAEKTDLLIMGADESKIINREIAIIRREIRSCYNIPENSFVVISGGKLDKRKQQNLLMEVIKQFAEENVWLIIFGEPTKEMKPIFEGYMNCSNIVQTGWIPSEKAYDFFLASDLAFFPGSHSVFWEQAVACSLPIVVKHWKGIEHINVNGNAILLDEMNIDTISQTIKELHNTTKYREMQAKAKSVASQFFLREIARKGIGE